MNQLVHLVPYTPVGAARLNYRFTSGVMGLRPFHPDDLARLAEIECLCNLTDPLAQFMAIDLRKNWTAHIHASAQFLAKKILESGCTCRVMTVDSPLVNHNKEDDVIAWAIWTRHSTNQ
jgi:hypothetical protein